MGEENYSSLPATRGGGGGGGGGRTEGRRPGGRGDGGKKERAVGRRPLVAKAESSLLTVMAAAVGDEPFGATTDRGYGERRRRRCTMRLAANGLAVAPDFFRYSNKLLQICKIVSMF